MNRLKLFCLSALLIIMSNKIFTQNITQTVKGQVIEKQTLAPLPGATVILLETDPLVGTTTNTDGYFVLENVPVGRVSLQVRYMGYHTATINNLNLMSGKELVVNVEMEEKVEKIDEVVITATRKGETINQMTSISARTFSVEETQRFAGAMNDVSRMAANYAGVCTSNDALNDIVIRGNSPSGLLWQLDGVDIPNPNHFGQLGATGGPVSMLNNNVLSNSDFMTGAFPAEYGNAL
ncbi:MAG: carboxypeptidase-like regulatory domain-containing protein, partial [Bacteroidales bacterium]|nr:carboxypeptidase-like regulatory domain-containing protein [Bacteroidales bacterium]